MKYSIPFVQAKWARHVVDRKIPHHLPRSHVQLMTFDFILIDRVPYLPTPVMTILCLFHKDFVNFKVSQLTQHGLANSKLCYCQMLLHNDNYLGNNT